MQRNINTRNFLSRQIERNSLSLPNLSPQHQMAKDVTYVVYECPHLSSCLTTGKKKTCKDCIGLNRQRVITHTANKSMHENCRSGCPVYGSKFWLALYCMYDLGLLSLTASVLSGSHQT